MSQSCYICNVPVGVALKDYVSVFGDCQTALQSGKKLHEVIAGIVEETPYMPSEISSVICKKCQKACYVYDSLKTRLQIIKGDIKENFRKSQLARNDVPKSVVKEPKKVVVPASKLQPLPANYVINVGNLAAGSLSAGNVLKLSNSLKASTASVIQNSNPTKSPLKLINASNIISSSSSSEMNENQITVTSVISSNRTKNPVMSFSINSLPKHFLSKDTGDTAENIKKEGNDLVEEENNDEQPMEIDEDCSLAVVSTADGNSKLVFENDKKTTSNLFDMGLLLSPEGEVRSSEREDKFILDKLQILDGTLDDDDDDDEQQTIVMENGTTIIRMGAGQQVMYDGEQFALVPAASDQENDDAHDSNDDSQIELQVSGDEETAKAIIAAAQEQGGAFIKVESGEMYRVQSVQSKTQDVLQDKMHLENLVEAQDGVYKCLLCKKNNEVSGKAFKSDADGIMLHLKNVHTARVYICQVCGHVMRKKNEYSKHIEEHAQKNQSVINKTKLHECDICKRKYNSRTLLGEHMNMHTGERPFTCAACGKSFASKYTLQAHLKTHEARPRPYKCHCGKAFFTQQNLCQHAKTHSGIKEFVCKVCQKAFATQHNLEVHCVVHTGKKPFVCHLCNKAFARKAEVVDHMRIHTGERPFACDICGATFTQRSNLHSHRRATHLGDKRHECNTCNKKFKRRRLLEYHIKAAHTGERPLACGVCRATFVYPEHYKKHIRIHSGERPYVCEVCGKSFNSRDNRNTHRFVHSDKKPYECLTCGVGYMRKQLLYAHMNTTGHVAESIVVNQPRVIKAVDNNQFTPLVGLNGEAVQIRTTKQISGLFEGTTELELDENDVDTVVTEDDDGGPKLYITGDKKIVLQDKSAINVLQDSDDSAFLTLHNFNGLIETNGDKIDDQATIVTTDEKGATMRLIQVQLEDGKSGWVAINN